MNSNLPSGTVTFLFTDIEGSTRLWQEYPQAMLHAHRRHDAILREAIESSAGYIFRVAGDAFCAAFRNAVEALRAALAAQRGLQAEAWGETGPLRVRMGLHTGTAEPDKEDPDAYFEGYTTLASVQRVMSVAHGGQVLLSQTTRDLLANQLPVGVSLRDLGQHRLKSLPSPLRLYQLVAPELPQNFPAIESLDYFPNNLPARLTSFIGRGKETADIKELLESTRLLTLTGPGGTGKTRLSLEVSSQVRPSFPHGIWFIALASMTDPSLIMPAVAQLLGLKGLPFAPLESLVMDYLREKRLLLILDNCEHLIEACAHLTHDLLFQCPELKIMANSREPLAIVGEVVYNVPPLAAAEATQLFLERARAVNPKVTFTASDKATVARICARLDGIPLAIELAAARVSLLSLEQIDARLDDRFRLLVGGDREALPRQKTLRALIDWSYDLLSEEERGLLRQLSVFSSGWTLEAIETICPDLDILTLMTELVNKSLVTKVEDMGAARFQLLETIRHYAREKLVEAGESEAAQASHAAYFRQLAERAGPKLATADSPRWLETLEAEHDNLRAAFEWWVERSAEDALRIVKALTYYWSLRGNQGEGRAWAEAAIAKVEALPGLEGEAALERKSLVAHVLLTLTMLAVMQGDNDYAEGVSEKCAALAREIGDKTLLAQVLTYTCSGRLVVGDSRGVEELMAEALSAARESGDAVALGMALSLSAEILMILDKDQETMRAFSEEGIALLEQSGNLWSLSIVLLDMGMTAKFKGRHDESRTRFAALEPLLRQLGDRHRLNLIRSEYGHMERYGGRIEAAEQVYRETIVEWRRLGHRAAVAHQLESFAFIARAQERPERAARLLGAAELLREKISIQMSPSERVEYEAEVEKLRQALDEARFNAHWAAGRTLSTDAAIAYALEQDEPLTTTG